MGWRAFNLAIETSSMAGSVTIGEGDQLLDTLELAQQRRHNVELMPAIDHLFRKYHARPTELGQVYVSIGPGSFTGLRIAVATAKMLALTLGADVVAVPTLDVVVQNVPTGHPYAAACLNTKGQQMYSGVYQCRADGWHSMLAAALMTPDDLCDRAPRPLTVIGDHLPPYEWPDNVQLIGPQLAVPRSEIVWNLGRASAKSNMFIDALELVPLYARRPEAEQLWAAGKRKNRKGESKKENGNGVKA